MHVKNASADDERHLVKFLAALGVGHLAAIEVEHENPNRRRKVAVFALRIDLANETRQICKT
jgi:hypothetical protein